MPPKLLLIGDAGVPTGYARVLRAIFEPLQGHFQITHLGTRYDGGRHDLPWKVLAASALGDPYGRPGLPGLIDDLRPDLVFLLYDLAHQAAYLQALRQARWRTRVVVYSPVESGPLEPEVLRDIGPVSRYVVFGHAAAAIVDAALRSPHAPGPSHMPAQVDVIPHGVDTRCFRPLPGGRAAARAALGLDLADDQAFIVLNANRNLAKKRLDLSLEGFAQFVAQAEGEVRLLLHTDPAGQGSYHLPTLVRRLGLGDQLILSPMAGRTEDALDNERLNVLYNACDVGLNTSVNEGFGLVAFEHAATGAAQVLPSTPVLKDLWQQAAVLLDSDRPAVNPGLLTLNYPVTAGAVANALARLHRDLPWRQHMSEAGRMHANLPGFAWPAILLQWRKLFSEVLARPA